MQDTMNDDTNRDTLIAETKHLRLVDRSGWSFAQRTTCSGTVCVVPVTRQGELVVIEQFRPPVARRVVEFPAGLVGDVAGEEHESLEQAARRELLEETGYGGGTFRLVADLPSSAGLTDEVVTLFIAEGIEKQGAGEGDGSEQITVHHVPLAKIFAWLADAAAAGKYIDPRVYAGLYLLSNGASAK